MTDIQRAMLGDHEAAARLTEQGVLIPCPCCKGDKVKVEHKSRRAGFTGLDDRAEYQTYSVRCKSCHARGPVYGGKVIVSFNYFCVTKDLPEWATTQMELSKAARLAWNTRAPLLTPEQIERLEEMK